MDSLATLSSQACRPEPAAGYVIPAAFSSRESGRGIHAGAEMDPRFRGDDGHLRSSRRIDLDRFDAACRDALKREADAWPKPGLVTPVDSGSHRDMSYASFVDSIAALRGYFADVAEVGARGGRYADLQPIAIAAEARMLAATRGANTHRGAIFNLGLLAAAAALRNERPELAGQCCGSIVAEHWGPAILASRSAAPGSHGNAVWKRYAVGGAREEAAAGFPAVYRVGLPALRGLVAAGVGEEEALVGTLMALMAELPDTNLLWRGGEAGLRDVQAAAVAFNRAGGVRQANWREALLEIHAWMVARNLSPGGSADLVAATWLVHGLDAGLPGGAASGRECLEAARGFAAGGCSHPSFTRKPKTAG